MILGNNKSITKIMSATLKNNAALIQNAVRSSNKIVSLADHRKKAAKQRQAEQQNEQFTKRKACS